MLTKKNQRAVTGCTEGLQNIPKSFSQIHWADLMCGAGQRRRAGPSGVHSSTFEKWQHVIYLQDKDPNQLLLQVLERGNKWNVTVTLWSGGRKRKGATENTKAHFIKMSSSKRLFPTRGSYIFKIWRRTETRTGAQMVFTPSKSKVLFQLYRLEQSR